MVGLLIPAPIVGLGGSMDRAFAIVAQNSPGVDLPTLVHADHGMHGVEGARIWAGYRPEAVLVENSRCDAEATEILRLAGVRALLLFGPEAVPYAPSLVIDQAVYGRLAVEHLVAHGHHRLAWLRPSDAQLQGLVEHRLAAATAAAQRCGATLDIVDMDSDPESLRDWARGLRYSPDLATGVIAYDDRFAYTAVRALAEGGLRVPDDVSVIGADDYTTSAVFLPAITTIAFDAQAMASLILRTLQQLRDGEEITIVRSPAARVLRRESA
ncbi:substrate-binding domain-containing protein [Nocardia asteroides]